MKTEEQVWQIIVDSNPVPDVNVYARGNTEGSAYLATLEKRSSEVTQVETKHKEEERSRRPKPSWLVAAALVVIAGVAAIVLSQDAAVDPANQPTLTTEVQEASPSEVVLASYADAVSAGDFDDVMSHYVWGSSIVVKRHPFALNDYMDRATEVRDTETLVQSYLGTGGRLEIFETVAGDPDSVAQPDVTFSWRFFYGDDGAEPTGWLWTRDGGPNVVAGETSCLGGRDAKVFMSAQKISEINWGFQDATKCGDQ